MNTMTGRFFSLVAGRQMLSDRQSSLPGVWPLRMLSPTLASKVLALPGLYMRGFWMHEAPNCVACSVSFQAVGATGAFQRSAPAGAWANGMPFQ